jgi:hypothetical protein
MEPKDEQFHVLPNYGIEGITVATTNRRST